MSSLFLLFVAAHSAVFPDPMGALESSAPAPCTAPTTAASSDFEFVSNPWINLYNFLVKEGKRARGIDDEGLGARGYLVEDTTAVRALTGDERKRWSAAIDFFVRSEIAGLLGIDSLVMNINLPLAMAAPDGDLEDIRLHPELRRVLLDVMPIYRAAWWPGHDRRNQLWSASMRAQLATHEQCLRQRAEEVFRAPWPRPIRVDASVFANWFGAYSTHNPTRITVSANSRGSQLAYGLEVLLHETAHGMLGPLDSALAMEAARQHKQLPRELSHLILFFTAGVLIRERAPLHIPFADAFGIWRQNSTASRYRDLIHRDWGPYVEGARPFCEAISALVNDL
jgi:hypothetical protein